MPNIDYLELLITVCIALIGWILTTYLQIKNIKDQHRTEVLYDIYRQFIDLRKKFQYSIINLSTNSNPPLVSMDSSMMPWRLNLKKEHNGVFTAWTEDECVVDGMQKWNEYIRKLYDAYFEFCNQNIELMGLFEDWMAPLLSLRKIQLIMQKEIERIKKKIIDDLSLLQMYSSTHGYDWRGWSEKNIRDIADRIRENGNCIGSYSYDFTVLVHNQLLSNFFRGKRPLRRTLDRKYRVLTEDGIFENLDHQMIKQIDRYTRTFILDAKIQLDTLSKEDEPKLNQKRLDLASIAEGICQDCKNPIQIVDIEESTDEFCYKYTCGHQWQC